MSVVEILLIVVLVAGIGVCVLFIVAVLYALVAPIIRAPACPGCKKGRLILRNLAKPGEPHFYRCKACGERFQRLGRGPLESAAHPRFASYFEGKEPPTKDEPSRPG